MVLQVVLIAVGVFLGLAGEEWRERTYGIQAMTNELGAGMMNAMYMRTPTADAFLAALRLYYDDLTEIEPNLVPAYDTLLMALDEALAE
jgi:hypothetical protein